MQYTAQKLWKVSLNLFQLIWDEASREKMQETYKEDRLSAVWFSAIDVPLDLLFILNGAASKGLSSSSNLFQLFTFNKPL